jgi:hypothetical protein
MPDLTSGSRRAATGGSISLQRRRDEVKLASLNLERQRVWLNIAEWQEQIAIAEKSVEGLDGQIAELEAELAKPPETEND